MKNLYDVIILGGGPAGLTAALFLSRARYRVLVLEKAQFGGQITITADVVNYPGVFEASGTEITDTMRRQAEAFGAEFLLAEATSLELDGDIKTVHTQQGDYQCFGLLIATGASPRMVGFEGEEAFKGRGVAYCATCDGEFFTGKDVFVIGGGYAAAEESVFLTKYAKHVTIMMRKDDFSCAAQTSEPAKTNEKITILPNTVVERASGETFLNHLEYKNVKTGEQFTYDAKDGDTFGIFVFAGYTPASELVKGLVELTPDGYVITDRFQKTNVDGVYAAGDICEKDLRQIATAVGDGATAASELERHASKMQKKTGIIPELPKQRAASKPEKAAKDASKSSDSNSELFDADMKAQLETLFDKMEQSLILELHLSEDDVSKELTGYMEGIAELTDKLQIRKISGSDEPHLPFVRILRSNEEKTGLEFHGVPGGHEFTSFVLGLYNAAGPGQPISDALAERIGAIDRPVDIQICVSLSCTMCPELVKSAQKIASINPNISTAVYDLQHFPDLKEKYQVMSVPCMIINQDHVSFGKKGLEELSTILESLD